MKHEIRFEMMKINCAKIILIQMSQMQSDKQEPMQPIIGSGKHRNAIDSDQEDEELFQKIKNAKVNQSNVSKEVEDNTKGRKKKPGDVETTPEKEDMQIQGRTIHLMKFHQLPQDVLFYLTDIYAFGTKLFISGMLSHGQTINLVATQPLKELYFCLKSQYSNSQITEQRKMQAKKQIDQRLRQCGIRDHISDFVEKEYVFEIDNIPRERRPYYMVRYAYSAGKDVKEEPKPDWEGETFKYVFGTTYTPLELFIVNTGLKGPGWVKVQKRFLCQNNKNVQSGLCADIQDPQLIQPVRDISKPPNMRVMSISIKAIIPAQVKLKKLFNTNRVDELHIFAISYFVCDDYQVEIKPNKYSGVTRTLFLKQFGAQSKDKNMIVCDNEKQMIALFQSEIRKYDPDVLVCHDSSRVLDTLIQRISKLGDKQDRPRLGRLVHLHQLSKVNQQQRINSTIAGRLLVDTFVHAKDMIKSVDYELQSMAQHIRPERTFKGMADQQILQNLNQNLTMHVIKKAKEEAEVTFALMNHLQILQITRQLSNICGNSWKRSLQIQRAERNQFLIMHQCNSRGLIIPDKFRKDKNVEEDEQVDKKKYQGGHVIDPMKGFYKDFILLLDFNSLYPSIIRQYNVCFSVIKRPLVPLSIFYKNKQKNNKKEKMEKAEEPMEIEQIQVVPPPKEECARQKWGFLPTLIDKIVDRRKKCKKAMKNASAEKCIILDIQQKCYKLVANSIYGCLGFSISRFYSKHLAALITRMGRQALLRAKDIVGAMGGVRVIYGDTDSLMIQPHGVEKDDDREKLFEIRNIAEELKKNINKEYSNLEIDVDGIFKPLILLMKKKYVARKLTNYDRIMAGLDNTLNFNIEYKGIEVVRRDSFELARRFLRRTLQILMNSTKSQPQQTYEQIYNFARQIRQKFSTINYKEFLFSKQLNKPPKDYARGETIPHVKVALDRIKAGQRQQVLVNHTIYYIVCKPKDATQDSLAKCCFDDRAFQRSQKFYDEKGPLEIDEEYYKRELVQPVWRITQHLEDFSTDKFLEELGLGDDSRKKFKRQMQAQREQGEAVLEGSISHSNIQKSKKFSDLLGEIVCMCGQNISAADKGKLTSSCMNCNKSLIATISNKLMMLLKSKINEYYTNRFKCRCGKQYSLNPLGDCCKIKYKPRSNIPFEIHEMIYIAMDLLHVNLREIAVKSIQTHPEGRKLKALEAKLEDFLRQSDFERVGNINSLFKL